MPNFDDFDLDLRGKQYPAEESRKGGVYITVEGMCNPDVITSLQLCTHNGKWGTCLCSTCCTGQTAPAGCSEGC